MMEDRKLGQTGIEVSRLCFGSLTIGPLQKNKTLEESRPIIEAALEAGINFFDTADLDNCYPYLEQALEIKNDLVICTSLRYSIIRRFLFISIGKKTPRLPFTIEIKSLRQTVKIRLRPVFIYKLVILEYCSNSVLPALQEVHRVRFSGN